MKNFTFALLYGKRVRLFQYFLKQKKGGLKKETGGARLKKPATPPGIVQRI
ncbi:MAG: hypothetical protein ACI8QI_000349 [Limisphaerales bacterium]